MTLSFYIAALIAQIDVKFSEVGFYHLQTGSLTSQASDLSILWRMAVNLGKT